LKNNDNIKTHTAFADFEKAFDRVTGRNY